MVLLVLLAIGTEPDKFTHDVEERIPFPSEWVLEWFEHDGLRWPPSTGNGLVLYKTGVGRLSLEDHAIGVRVHYIDAAGRHARLDLRYGRAAFPEPRDAIYHLDHDRLLLCLGENKTPPADFSTKPGDGRLLLSFKRKK